MPDKRNVSKQRRAARNRQSREALTARRENSVSAAVPSPPAPASRRGGRAAGSRAAGTGRGAPRPRPTFVAPAPPAPGLKGLVTGSRPGDRWVLGAFLAAVAVAVVTLVVTQVPVDDRGEVLPNRFAGLTVAAREALTGARLDDASKSLVSAYGPLAFGLVGAPVVISAFALWANRRADRGRLLTFTLVALAGAVMLFPMSLLAFIPLILLAVGAFTVRRSDVVVPAAAPGPSPAGGRDAVIEADAREGDPRPAPARPSLLDRLLGGATGSRPSRAGGSRSGPATRGAGEPTADEEAEAAGAPPAGPGSGGAPPAGAAATDTPAEDGALPGGEADPLAELEAELAAEAQAERSPDVADDPSSPSPRNRRPR
ncbi:MAG TPA: hypothetical protein VFW63_11755 [Acidimicrobiales bacterium]|nr:hypothetical protein [Acidimicrobiales bacterium]